MWTAGRSAKKVFQQPGAFALAVVKQFRANQGVLLAGAVAYYTLLSLVPLLILILMALSHIIPEDRLLLTLSEYLEFVVPGQSTALVEEVRTFLAHKQVVGGILFVTFLQCLGVYNPRECDVGDLLSPGQNQTAAFSGVRRDAIPIHPVSGCGSSRCHRSLGSAAVRRHPEHRDFRSAALTGPNLHFSALYRRSYRRDVAPHRNLFHHAGGTIVGASRTDWWGDGYAALGNDASHPGMVLRNDVANPTGLRLAHHRHRRAIERGNWGFGPTGRRASDRGI